jgi:glycerol kinase
MLDNHPEVATAHEADDLLFGTVESWVLYNLLGGAAANIHLSEVTNASRTLLLNTATLQWEPSLLDFFGFRPSILPKLVSTSEVYGKIAAGPLAGVPVGGLVGDQQGALVGNKCLKQGEAKCTYGTGAFLLFCTGGEIVKSNHGLLSTVSAVVALSGCRPLIPCRSHTQPDPGPSPCTRSRAPSPSLGARSSGSATR